MRYKTLVCLVAGFLVLRNSAAMAQMPSDMAGNTAPSLDTPLPPAAAQVQGRPQNTGIAFPTPKIPVYKKPNYTFLYVVGVILVGAAIAGLLHAWSQVSETPVNEDI
jgi:hypothetical protein